MNPTVEDSPKNVDNYLVADTWFQSWVEETRLIRTALLQEQVWLALTHHFPEKLSECLAADFDSQKLLQRIEIQAVVELEVRTAWTATTNEAEAISLLAKYSQSNYANFRQELGIKGHWILLFDSSLLATTEELFEAHVELEDWEKQGCTIVRL